MVRSALDKHDLLTSGITHGVFFGDDAHFPALFTLSH